MLIFHAEYKDVLMFYLQYVLLPGVSSSAHNDKTHLDQNYKIHYNVSQSLSDSLSALVPSLCLAMYIRV